MGEHSWTVPAAWADRASRATTAGAGALAALAGVAAAAIVIGLRVANDGAEPLGQNWWLVAWLVVGLVNAVVGAVLLTRDGPRRLAGCLLLLGLAALLVAVTTQAKGFVEHASDGTAWAEVTGARAWADPMATGILVALVPWALLSARRRGRSELLWYATAMFVVAGAVAAAAGFADDGFDVVDATTWVVATSAAAGTAMLVAAWWHSSRLSGDPLAGWLAAGAVAAWIAVVPGRLGFGERVPGDEITGSLLLLATVPLLLVGVVVDVLRERPGRFHGIAHGAIAWLALCSAIVVVYTGLVAGLGRLVGGSGPTWLLVAATGAIAVGVEPVRGRIRHAVDRLVWGIRDDPLEVVRSVVDHVGPDSGDELLPALVASLQRELRLDAVAIDVRTPDGWRRAAALGPPTTYERTVTLEQRGEAVGRLIVGWQHGPFLRSRDQRVLDELAGPLGLAVGWVRLAADLRRSSVAIVSAREEERRRLRRDLHDGLGPALTGVSLGLRTSLRQLQRSTDTEDLVTPQRLLEHAADEVDRLVVDVKRIVRDLRPTALDQFGLLGAVTEFARAFDGELDIQLSIPDGLLELPAAVEVATYRIVTEAVTNVVRHAHAGRCWLTISAGSTVEIDVVDDGVGVLDDGRAGVGWTAMRERAAELGGMVEVSARRPQGTRVHVQLPAVLP